MILERLLQADCIDVFMGSDRPECTAYWNRLRARPAYREAILDHANEIVEFGTQRLQQTKAADAKLRLLLEGG